MVATSRITALIKKRGTLATWLKPGTPVVDLVAGTTTPGTPTSYEVNVAVRDLADTPLVGDQVTTGSRVLNVPGNVPFTPAQGDKVSLYGVTYEVVDSFPYRWNGIVMYKVTVKS